MRTRTALALGGLLLISQTGCGGTAGAWLWWLTNPERKVEAEYKIGPGRLLILVDDDKGRLPNPTMRPLLRTALVKQFEEHKVCKEFVPVEAIVRLRQRDSQFARRGAREIGRRLDADIVLQLNVRTFTLHHNTVKPAYKGQFMVTVKVLDAHATSPEDVRLWPQSTEGKTVEVETELHTGKGSSYDDQLTRRLCDEMAEKIAKLFYEHKVRKEL